MASTADASQPGPEVHVHGGQGVQVGTGNRQLNIGDLKIFEAPVLIGDGVQINYSYQMTWSDGVTPPPLADRSGAVASPYRGLAAFGERDAHFISAGKRPLLMSWSGCPGA
jgi:hypothetical protein